VGAVLFISSFRVSLPSGDTTGAARRVERVLNRRMALLDTYAGQALAQDPAQWMTLEGLPRDMVVYRYCRDTLQSWSHAFPIATTTSTSAFTCLSWRIPAWARNPRCCRRKTPSVSCAWARTGTC
jgi:hypothetical protein